MERKTELMEATSAGARVLAYSSKKKKAVVEQDGVQRTVPITPYEALSLVYTRAVEDDSLVDVDEGPEA